MKTIVKIVFFIGLLFTILNAENNKYLLVNEYLTKNPQQKQISKHFVNLIRNESVKLSINQKRKVKIVIIYPGNQISDYWRRSKVSFEKRLDELNISYELKDYFSKPGEIKTQLKHLLKAVKADTDYLVFSLDALKHAEFIEQIISRKKPKLILQNITTPLKKWRNRQPFQYVGFDHVIGSRILADYYISKIGAKGNYAVLYGTKGYVSHMRGKEFINYISQKTNLKLVDSYYTDVNKEKAAKATIQLIKEHKNIKFIYSTTTDIALSVAEVLAKNKLTGEILINGWGGGSNELKAIEKGLLDITVMRINDDNGIAMAEAVKLDMEGKTHKVPTIFSGDFAVVKKGIKKEKLQLLKEKAFRYSN